MHALMITSEASSEDDASSFCRQPYRRLSTQLPPSSASAVALIVSKIVSSIFYATNLLFFIQISRMQCLEIQATAT